MVVIIKSCRHFFSSTGQKLEERGEELDSCRHDRATVDVEHLQLLLFSIVGNMS